MAYSSERPPLFVVGPSTGSGSPLSLVGDKAVSVGAGSPTRGYTIGPPEEPNILLGGLQGPGVGGGMLRYHHSTP